MTSASSGASLSKPERPKSMGAKGIFYDSSEDEERPVPSRANSKKWRQSLKAKGRNMTPSAATHNATENQFQSSASDSRENSDDIQPKTAAQKKFMKPMNPRQVRVRDHDADGEVVSGSEIGIPKSKPKQTALRSGDELSYDPLPEIPTISSAKPKPPSPSVNQKPPSSRPPATFVHTQEQASLLPPVILPFPVDLPGPEENCELVRPEDREFVQPKDCELVPPKDHDVLVLPNREIHFCPDQEVSCHCINMFCS